MSLSVELSFITLRFQNILSFKIGQNSPPDKEKDILDDCQNAMSHYVLTGVLPSQHKGLEQLAREHIHLQQTLGHFYVNSIISST